jgi:hypothetical protein
MKKQKQVMRPELNKDGKPVRFLVEHGNGVNPTTVYDGSDRSSALSAFNDAVEKDPTLDVMWWCDGSLEKEHIGTNLCGHVVTYYDKRQIQIGTLDLDGCLWLCPSGRCSRWAMSRNEKGDWQGVTKHITLDDQDHELHCYNIGGFGHRDLDRDGPGFAAMCEGLSKVYAKLIPHKTHHI